MLSEDYDIQEILLEVVGVEGLMARRGHGNAL
jgi:hypothetical protein